MLIVHEVGNACFVMFVFFCFVVQVNMLRERNKRYGTIKFVDISSADYSPGDNQGLDYRTVSMFNLRVREDALVWRMLAECVCFSGNGKDPRDSCGRNYRNRCGSAVLSLTLFLKWG